MRLLLFTTLVLITGCQRDLRSANELHAAAEAALEATEVAEAVRFYERAAAKGSTDAMRELHRAYTGQMLHNRRGWAVGAIRPDTAEAARYHALRVDSLTARSRRGSDQAQTELLWIAWSEAMSQDARTGIATDIRTAAEAGNPSAMSSYAFLAHMGRDDEQFAYWARQAAEAGDAFGQSLLATAYEHGMGMEADPEQHRYWLEKAAQAIDTPYGQQALRELRALAMHTGG